MELSTRVDVDAPPEQVWAVLTDFDRYHEWNPFVRIVGRPTRNARLHVELTPPGGRTVRLRPTVTRAEQGRELRWLGHLWRPGVFDGEHRFVLEPLDGGSRTAVTHAEVFTGTLVPLLWRVVGAGTERGFEAMNAALKRRVEDAIRDEGVQSTTATGERPAT
jgi:hypothetical protein